MMDLSWAATTAALVTTLTLLITFVALFAMMAFSVWSGLRADAAYQEHLSEPQAKRPYRISPNPTAA